MHLPAPAFFAYAATVAIALAAAVAHPWFDDAEHRSERRFVKAVAELGSLASDALATGTTNSPGTTGAR
jgi:hypothetical protein